MFVGNKENVGCLGTGWGINKMQAVEVYVGRKGINEMQAV